MGCVFKAIRIAGPYAYEVVPAIVGTQFSVSGLPIYFADLDSFGNMVQQDVYVSGAITSDSITLNNQYSGNNYSQVISIMGVDESAPSNTLTPYSWIHSRLGGLGGSPDVWIPVYSNY